MANKFVSALKNRPEESIQQTNTKEKKVSIHDRPSRKNTKHIGGYFSDEVSKQLRQIALDEDSTVQQLLGEAIDMILHSRQKPTIAQKTTT